MKINEIIKVARDKRGMAQSELALRIGKSTRMIQKYESGEVIPNLEVLSEIAKALALVIREENTLDILITLVEILRYMEEREND
ncbi:MAG: helix-turn-helix domain-containing protein [Clostridium perfringens]|nr:helix-turn-helix domain-containing protein [Clostridium perfringens]